jgi:hypothetical protein
METRQVGGVQYVEDNEIEKLMSQEENQEIKMPPYPVPFRPWDDKDFRYNGDVNDYKKRIHDKMLKIWYMWGNLRGNLDLEELLSRPEEDKNSDAYVAKNCIVDIMNALAKYLVDTNLIEEMAWLSMENDEFKSFLEKKEKIESEKNKK